jgi:hypothetical protein
MNFLKNLFGGGGSSSSGDTAYDRDGIYVYVQPNGCDEVIRVRVNRMNDLSETDDGGTYFAHKVARGVKCRQNVELDLYFDGQRRIADRSCTGGAFVEEKDYQAWVQTNQSPS